MLGGTALFSLCAILGGIITGTRAQDTATVNTNCQEPWNATVSSELVVTWSGVDRTGDVRVDFLAIDPPSAVKCTKKLSVNTLFSDYEVSLPESKKACSGTRYNVTVTLKCDTINEEYVVQVFVPPEDLTQVKNANAGLVTDETIEIQWDPLQIHGRPNISYTVQWHALDDASPAEDSTPNYSYTITKLSPYQEYSIKVRAHSGQDTGNWSEELIVKTKSGVPSEPQNLKITRDSTTLWIKWEEPSPFRGPILNYTVLWKERKDITTNTYTEVNTSSTNYVVDNLVPLTTYFVRVRAYTETRRGHLTNVSFVETKRNNSFFSWGGNLCPIVQWIRYEGFTGKFSRQVALEVTHIKASRNFPYGLVWT